MTVPACAHAWEVRPEQSKALGAPDVGLAELVEGEVEGAVAEGGGGAQGRVVAERLAVHEVLLGLVLALLLQCLEFLDLDAGEAGEGLLDLPQARFDLGLLRRLHGLGALRAVQGLLGLGVEGAEPGLAGGQVGEYLLLVGGGAVQYVALPEEVLRGAAGEQREVGRDAALLVHPVGQHRDLVAAGGDGDPLVGQLAVDGGGLGALGVGDLLGLVVRLGGRLRLQVEVLQPGQQRGQRDGGLRRRIVGCGGGPRCERGEEQGARAHGADAGGGRAQPPSAAAPLAVGPRPPVGPGHPAPPYPSVTPRPSG
jgi:hypothetical protein